MAQAGAAPSAEAGDAILARLAAAAQARFRTSEEAAVAFLRDAILSGQFRPGDHLNQDRIARALGMSRIPIRAALRQLEAERLVTIHPFRGSTVATRTPDEIAELYDLRITVECLALSYVAQSLTPEVFARILPDARHLDAAEVVDEAWIAARDRLYDALFAASGRERTIRLVASLRTELAGYIAAHQVHRVRVDHAGHVGHTGHVGFLTMLRDRDAAGAIAWHRPHLLAVRDMVLRNVQGEAA